MLSRFQRSESAARAIAIFGAALILVSQAVGAAHFHAGASSRNGVTVAQIAVDEGLCPLCEFAAHSPGSVSSTPTVVRGPAIADAVFLTSPRRPQSPIFTAVRVRAPPVTL